MTDESTAGSPASDPAPETSPDTAPEPVQTQEPPGPPTFSPPTQPPPGWRPPRQRLRDRLFRFRSVLAVGVAGLLIGGGAGAGGMAIANSGSDGGTVPGRGPFPGQHRFPGGGPFGQFPGPGAGQGADDGESLQGGSNS